MAAWAKSWRAPARNHVYLPPLSLHFTRQRPGGMPKASMLCGSIGQGGAAKRIDLTWQHKSNDGARLHETISTYHHYAYILPGSLDQGGER